MDALGVVEERVREGVRSRGIDPLHDPDLVRGFVDVAVAAGESRDPGDKKAVDFKWEPSKTLLRGSSSGTSIVNGGGAPLQT